uniref:Transposase n=1 Tax=Ditylenchus dipsaci TaxID=166011 RepID=A0A915D168_9BILA
MWKGYNGLKSNELALSHLTVNHKQNFADPVTGAHTNIVERMWRSSKKRSKDQSGTARQHLEAYLVEFWWRNRVKDKDPFAESFPLCKVNSRINVGKKTLGHLKLVPLPSALLTIYCCWIFRLLSVLLLWDAQREKSMKYKSLREGANALGDGQLTGLSVATSETKEKVIVLLFKQLEEAHRLMKKEILPSEEQ